MNQLDTQPKIIVIDDDPTGSQTVHSCLLLLRWDVETLKQGLQDDVPILFILSNTRAMTPEQAAGTTQEVCHNLKIAIAEANIKDFVASYIKQDMKLKKTVAPTMNMHLVTFDPNTSTPKEMIGWIKERDEVMNVEFNKQLDVRED